MRFVNGMQTVASEWQTTIFIPVLPFVAVVRHWWWRVLDPDLLSSLRNEGKRPVGCGDDLLSSCQVFASCVETSGAANLERDEGHG
jgi:hypothetical protein